MCDILCCVSDPEAVALKVAGSIPAFLRKAVVGSGGYITSCGILPSAQRE